MTWDAPSPTSEDQPDPRRRLRAALELRPYYCSRSTFTTCTSLTLDYTKPLTDGRLTLRYLRLLDFSYMSYMYFSYALSLTSVPRPRPRKILSRAGRILRTRAVWRAPTQVMCSSASSTFSTSSVPTVLLTSAYCAPIQAYLLTCNARFRLFESSLAPRWRQRVGVSALAGLQEREASNEGAQMASPLSDHKPLEQPRWARCCQLELLGL